MSYPWGTADGRAREPVPSNPKSEIPDSNFASRFHELENEPLHVAQQRVAAAKRFREELEGDDESAAFGGAAPAEHRPAVADRRRVIEPDFLTRIDRADRDKRRVLDDGGVGSAGMVDEPPRFVEIQVAVDADLQGIGRLRRPFSRTSFNVNTGPEKCRISVPAAIGSPANRPRPTGQASM